MNHKTELSDTFLLSIVAIPIGMVIGVICALFGRVLLAITAFRGSHSFLLIPFLPIAGAFVVWYYQKYGKGAEKGMSLVFEVGHGEAEEIPLRLIPFVMVGTWLTHLFGGSAGREGVAVQIGATFSHWMGKKIPLEGSERIFLVSGMAAGFAGLFQTPFAAVFFSLEVLLAGSLELRALLPSMSAAFTAAMVSGYLGLEKFTFDLTATYDIGLHSAGKLVVLGVLFGMVGGGFAWVLKRLKGIFAQTFQNPIVRIAVVGVVVSALLLLMGQGRYAGLGTNLISASFHGEDIYPVDWALKFLLTTVTLAAGYQGGEVTPLFSIGASLGVLLGSWMGLPVELAAALGYAAVFGSASNTLIAPMLIGAEVFGFAYLPHFFVVCAVAYALNGNQSIYTKQRLSASLLMEETQKAHK